MSDPATRRPIQPLKIRNTRNTCLGKPKNLNPTTIFATTILLTASLSLPLEAADRPNVLFIAIDDLNDWIGCLQGHPQAETPNIDRLARRGILFTNAHCAAPACNPSRAAVFSGQRPDRTGVWSNDSRKLSRLKPKLKQLPEWLATHGYHTLGTGKLSGDKSTRYSNSFATEQRWSPFSGELVEYSQSELPTKGTEHPRHVLQDHLGRQVVLPLNRMPSDRKPGERAGESFDWGPCDFPDSDFGDTQITNWAVQQLQQSGTTPFFLGVGYYRPHIPLYAPSRFFDRFRNAPGKLPATQPNDLADLSSVARKWALEPITAGRHSTVQKHDQWQAAVEAYLACVTYVDQEVGRLLDALEQSPADNNTLIILWSDHGWHLGEKEHWGKWTGWERATRVPLIIVPDQARAKRFSTTGSTCDAPVNLVDLYPTLIELCKVPNPPHALDGQSLVPLLEHPKLPTDRHSLTLFDPGNASLRTDGWRYIRYADGSEELYDMNSDPNEWKNLSNSKPYLQQKDDLASTLTRLLQSLE